MTQYIQEKLYSYDPHEFFPIWENGELSNRNKFIAYKAKQVFHYLINK